MKNNSIGVVFIHGTGVGSYVWDVVMAKLGMPVLALDFPHRGNKLALKDLTLKDYVNPIVREIKNWNQQRIILVTHSFGGIVGLKVAEELRYQQLAGFVAISASIPKNGESFISSLPFPQNVFLNIMVKIIGTMPPKSTIRKGLCNDLTEAQTQKIIESFVPEAKSVFYETIETKIPEVKKMYIKLLQDRNIPVAVQEKMAQNLKADKVIAFNSGHMAMLSVPDQIANAIKEFAKELDKEFFNPTNTDFTMKGKKEKVKS